MDQQELPIVTPGVELSINHTDESRMLRRMDEITSYLKQRFSISKSTVYRWRSEGVQVGDQIVVLDAIKIGRSNWTSYEAVDRFLEMVTPGLPQESTEISTPAPNVNVCKENVDKALESYGINLPDKSEQMARIKKIEAEYEDR